MVARPNSSKNQDGSGHFSKGKGVYILIPKTWGIAMWQAPGPTIVESLD